VIANDRLKSSLVLWLHKVIQCPGWQRAEGAFRWRKYRVGSRAFQLIYKASRAESPPERGDEARDYGDAATFIATGIATGIALNRCGRGDFRQHEGSHSQNGYNDK
jgi:hypothetical protein